MNAKAKILVVDDDQDIKEQVALVLRGAGYEVLTAGSRDEAEELLLGGKPDLAVLDLMMESMDAGFVLAHRLNELYPGTPVILLTAVTASTGLSFDAASREALAWMKAGRVLDKPVRADQLKAEVRKMLSQADRSGAGTPARQD
jgi:CheY-like chemotaxis protein